MKRRAKIIATIGPSSNSVELIKDLINAGMNVCRVNMSHGDHATHLISINNIRQASKLLGQEVAVLVDLQGPKIRVDKLEKHLDLAKREKWAIGLKENQNAYPEYSEKFIPTTYGDMVKDCRKADDVLFDDGLIRATVVELKPKAVIIEVIVGGTLKSNKGINLPQTKVSVPSFTDKDQEDLDL